MRWFRSIRVRFTAWYLVVLAVLLVGLAVGLHAFLSYTLQRTQDLALERRAAGLAGSREVQDALNRGTVAGGLGEIIAFYRQRAQGYNVVSSRDVDQDINPNWIAAAFRGEPGLYTAVTGDGTSLRFFIAKLPPPPQTLGASNSGAAAHQTQGTAQSTTASEASLEPVVVVVGQPMDRIITSLAALRRTLWIAVPLTLFLSAGGGLFLVRRALKPIDHMIEIARGIEESDLSGRVPVDSSDELGRLARTLNAMLSRLENAFSRQRQFTNDASHELRSPLSVIEAEATLALRKPRDAESYQSSLSVIADESSTMHRLIDQLLTLARSDEDQDSTAPESVDLLDLTIDTIAAMSPVAEDKGVDLTSVAPGEPDGVPPVMGDPTQLRRVLMNLIDNAIRYTDSGGTITVSVEPRGAHIEWTVTDTGYGISAEHLEHVFDRFYRADTTRSRRSGGSGLGLAICRQIVDAHGGSISVASEPGVGTTFTVRLPAARTPGTVIS